MNKYWLPFVLCMLAFPYGASAAVDDKTADSKKGLPVDELLTKVQEALITVQDDAHAMHLPPLDSVQLELSTNFSVDGKGKISLFVITLGGGGGRESGQTLKLALAPPSKGTPSPHSSDSISQTLSQLILSGAEAAQKAKNRKPPLALDELAAQIRFVVKMDGGGSAKFEVTPIGFELGGDVSSNEIQEITVSFKEKKQKAK